MPGRMTVDVAGLDIEVGGDQRNARGFMLGRLDDLDAELFEPEP